MLIGGSRKPFSGVIEPSQLPQIRVRTSMGVQNIVSSAGPKTSSLVVAQKQADCGTVNLSSKIVADGTLGTLAVKVCLRFVLISIFKMVKLKSKIFKYIFSEN